MTREEAIKRLKANRGAMYFPETIEALDMAIDALSADAIQDCDGCRYNTPTPQKQCLRCKRYWRDSYERKGGEEE